MAEPDIYVLDSGVLIEAARHYYAFDLAPGFWTSLAELATAGRLVSVDKVKQELDRGKDELKDWAIANFGQWFFSTDEPEVLGAYGNVVRWAHAQAQYTDAAKAEFAKDEVADAWVIAFAKAKGCTVVSQEGSNPNRRNKILMPVACRSLAVPCINTFDMLRALGVKF